MARTNILYRFTIGKPFKVDSNYFTPYKTEEKPVKLLSEFYNTDNPYNSYIFTDHQITFDVKMSDEPNPNVGHFTLTNPDKEVVDYVTNASGENIVCILEAGDNEQGLIKIFEGTAVNAYKIEDDTEVKLKMSLGDASVNTQNAKTVRTYPRGTKYETIMKDLRTDLMLPIAKFSGVVGEIPSAIVLSGSAHDIMKKLAPSLQVDYSIQNGEINIVPWRRQVKKEVSVITPTTGLLGKIRKGVDDKSSSSTTKAPSSDTIEFTCLLDGALKPTESVYVDDGEIAGSFRIKAVSFQGDYEGGVWICNVKAFRTEGVLE